VRRFVVPGLLQDLAIPLGQDPNFGSFIARDIQVAPAAPHTIAVSPANLGFSPSAQGGVVIFDDGTARPTRAPGFSTGNLFDSLQWGSDATTLFAANNESSGFDFYTLAVTAAGVSLVHDAPGALGSFGSRIHFDRVTGLTYSDGGRVVDGSGVLQGTFAASGTMVPDAALNRAFFFTSFTPPNLRSFDLTHFTPADSLNIQGLGSFSFFAQRGPVRRRRAGRADGRRARARAWPAGPPRIDDTEPGALHRLALARERGGAEPEPEAGGVRDRVRAGLGGAVERPRAQHDVRQRDAPRRLHSSERPRRRCVGAGGGGEPVTGGRFVAVGHVRRHALNAAIRL